MRFLVVFAFVLFVGYTASIPLDDLVEEVENFEEGLHDEELLRPRRFAPGENRFPGQNPNADRENDGGSWSIGVNKDKGQGPQVRAEGEKNIYSSADGNIRVDTRGHYEAGRGRKPDYGVGISVNGRWRRFAPGRTQNPNVGGKDERGSWGVSVNKDKGRGPQVRGEAERNIYSSRDGNVRVDAHGRVEAGKGRKPDYSTGVSVKGRWRRFAAGGNFPGQNPSAGGRNDRGSWGVSVNKDKGRGPQVRAEGERNIYSSRNGNVRVDAQGRYEAGRGRKPDYGAGVSIKGRF